MKQIELTIITGMSGAGRSSAGDVLEDLGFYCIDNIPAALLKAFGSVDAVREVRRL